MLLFGRFGAALVAVGVLSACGGPHAATVPGLPVGAQSAIVERDAPAVAPAASGDVIAINAGGPAVAGFAADEDYRPHAATASTAAAIDTTGVTGAAPAAVYQNIRYGAAVTYTIPGLTAGATYTVRLHFAEITFSSAQRRVFNVAINSTQVLANLDIFAAAGGKNKALVESFAAKASSSGSIAISMQATTNYAAICGLEVLPGTGSASPPPVAFNDYSTFGYSNARDVFNPNSAALTPATVSSVHLAWQAALGGGDYNTQTQPVLATEIAQHAGVLFVGGGTGNVYGYDAETGHLLWTRFIGQETYTCENSTTLYFGVGGTVAYDPASRSLYVVGNANSAPNALAKNTLFHLDGATGAELGEVDFAPATPGWPSLDFSHTAVTLGSNGLAYVGTGGTCDISSWRGRIAAVSVPAMSLAETFFTVWNGTSQPWGGGGVWGWGGVSLDADNNVLTGVGNTDNGTTTHGRIVAPFAPAPTEYSGYGEALVKVSPTLSRVWSSAHPIPVSAYSGSSVDLDLQGTPVLFAPSGAGCGQMAALQAKSGTLFFYQLAGGTVLRGQFALAPSSYQDSFIGGPAYSAATGLVYAAVPSSMGSLFPPGMVAIDPGCGTPFVAWHSAFGPDTGAEGSPRGVPAVSAGGLVFVGTPCDPDGNGGCTGDVPGSVARSAAAAQRRPAICCAPPGTEGGALWVLDASTGSVLNGGLPLLTTGGPIRMPATIDGDWIFVLDNSGNMYGLTIDPNYPAIAATAREADPRMLKVWEPRPGR